LSIPGKNASVAWTRPSVRARRPVVESRGQRTTLPVMLSAVYSPDSRENGVVERSSDTKENRVQHELEQSL
jgi:hypothetical protein